MPSTNRTRLGLCQWVSTNKPKRLDLNGDRRIIQRQLDRMDQEHRDIREAMVGQKAQGQDAEIFNAYPGDQEPNQAAGDCAHAQGHGTSAYGYASHTEGLRTTAEGDFSHAQGISTAAAGYAAHAQGAETRAVGDYTHAGGLGTIALDEAQTTLGRYNAEEPDAALVVGGGASDTQRTTIFKVDWSGAAWSHGARIIIEQELRQAEERLYQRISELIGGAPEALDTLEEIADWILTHQDLYEDTLAEVQEIAGRNESHRLDLETLNAWTIQHILDRQQLISTMELQNDPIQSSAQTLGDHHDRIERLKEGPQATWNYVLGRWALGKLPFYGADKPVFRVVYRGVALDSEQIFANTLQQEQTRQTRRLLALKEQLDEIEALLDEINGEVV